MQADTKFWDKVAEKYAKRPVSNPNAYQQTLDRTRSYLGAEDQVLEIGCGTGSTALVLAPHVARYTASDFSAEMVRIASEKQAAEALPSLHVQQAGADDMVADPGTLDAVLAFNLLHLTPDMDAVLRAAHAQLKSGGVLISKTVCLAHANPFLRLLLPVMKLFYGIGHVGVFTRDALEERITAQGFKIVETGDYPAKPPSRFVVARKI